MQGACTVVTSTSTKYYISGKKYGEKLKNTGVCVWKKLHNAVKIQPYTMQVNQGMLQRCDH